MDHDTEEFKCGICGEALTPDSMCIKDINFGSVHAECSGPEREGYVNLETGEPLGPDEQLPTPYRYGDL